LLKGGNLLTCELKKLLLEIQQLNSQKLELKKKARKFIIIKLIEMTAGILIAHKLLPPALLNLIVVLIEILKIIGG